LVWDAMGWLLLKSERGRSLRETGPLPGKS
jgi:hypothetical protein